MSAAATPRADKRVPTPAQPRIARAIEALILLITFSPLLFLYAGAELAQADRTRGALLWIACVVPTAIYVMRRRTRREPFPFFPLVGIVFGIYFAIPALTGTVNLAYLPNQVTINYLDPAHDFARATELALWGWIMLLFGYWTLSFFVRPLRVRERPWPARALVPWLMRIMIAGMFGEMLQTSFRLPGWFGGAMGFFAVASRFALATLVVMRVKNQLAPIERTIVLIAIPIELLLLLGAGSIAKVFLFVLLLLLANWLGGGRVRAMWLAGGLVAALTLVTVKGILGNYRRQAWFAGVALNVPDRMLLMGGLVGDQIRAQGVAGAIETGWMAAISRSADLDVLADVVQRTPRDVPYWGGKTYYSLVGFAVPRILWPSKPTKTLGQDFGHRYSYLGSWDQSTSMNFPYIVEFYANFGPIGVFAGMFLTGMIFRLLDLTLNRRGQSVVRSIASMSMLIPLLNVESDFSLVFGGVFLNGVAFIVVLRFLRARVDGNAREHTTRSTPVARPLLTPP
jgi:hypothetical protein